jgi:hypothetical protein
MRRDAKHHVNRNTERPHGNLWHCKHTRNYYKNCLFLQRVPKYKAVPQKAQRASKPKKKDNETKQRGILKPQTRSHSSLQIIANDPE